MTKEDTLYCLKFNIPNFWHPSAQMGQIALLSARDSQILQSLVVIVHILAPSHPVQKNVAYKSQSMREMGLETPVLNLMSKPPSLVLTLNQYCNDDERSIHVSQCTLNTTVHSCATKCFPMMGVHSNAWEALSYNPVHYHAFSYIPVHYHVPSALTCVPMGDEYWLHSLQKQSRWLGLYNKILKQLLVGKMEYHTVWTKRQEIYNYQYLFLWLVTKLFKTTDCG